jgi:hypothetical protein
MATNLGKPVRLRNDGGAQLELSNSGTQTTLTGRNGAGGGLGVNTTDPVNTLHVNKDRNYTPTVGVFGGSGAVVVQGAEPGIVISQDISSAGVATGAETAAGGMGFVYFSPSDFNNLRVGTQTNHDTIVRTNNVDRVRFRSTGETVPATNNAFSLGDNTNRWTEVFAVNGTINTSDANAKTDVAEDVPALEFVNQLRPVSYRWKVRKNEVVQGEDGPEVVAHPGVRRHLGFIAQEVRAALGSQDFGIYTKDAETGEAGLRYDQFAPILVKALQEATARIEALEAKLAAMETGK